MEMMQKLFCSQRAATERSYLGALITFDYSLFHSEGAGFVRASSKQDRDRAGNIITALAT